MKIFYPITVILIAFCSSNVFSEQSAKVGERISFVSCPVVRDTPSVPCWTSNHNGATYYLTIQSDVSAGVQPPMLGHKVLVEGIISSDKKICDGIVLKEINISVMPERDANCNKMLPSEEHIRINFNPRPPGPSRGRLAFEPDPNDAKANQVIPKGPQTINLYFDFDKAVSFRHPVELLKIIELANTIGATTARITGLRGAHLLSDGSLLQESINTGRNRAQEVATLLQGAGLTAKTEIEWLDAKIDDAGKNDWQSRRVTVQLQP